MNKDIKKELKERWGKYACSPVHALGIQEPVIDAMLKDVDTHFIAMVDHEEVVKRLKKDLEKGIEKGMKDGMYLEELSQGENEIKTSRDRAVNKALQDLKDKLL